MKTEAFSPINQIVSPAILEDLEFHNQGVTPFLTETKAQSICLALSTEQYRRQLACNFRFLHMLLQSYPQWTRVPLFTEGMQIN